MAPEKTANSNANTSSYRAPLTLWLIALMAVLLSVFSGTIYAHGVDDSTRVFLQNNEGVQFIPFLYIGAKHMVTGYDHLLFLVGVLFFLYRAKDVLIFVSLFTLGHSITLLLGVLENIQVNPYLIDAIIGFSVVYKGFDNLGGFQRLPIKLPSAKVIVFIFGLFHGFGLATKLQEFALPTEGLATNLISFNIGVELGQFTALSFIFLIISYWRKYPSFIRFSTLSNTLLMFAGFLLVGYQLTGYFTA